jgi:hypothetical protein
MSLFKCDKCGAVENTALSRFWFREIDPKTQWFAGPALCSECDPRIGKWHGAFPKEPAAGAYMLGNDGSLYTIESVQNGSLKWRMEHRGLRILGPA